MKKFLTIVLCALMLGGVAMAQPRAIGIRSGVLGHEISFQYSFQDYQFLQIDLGTVGFFPEGFRLTGTYNFIFSEPQWTSRGDWAWFAGVGAAIGMKHEEERSADVETGKPHVDSYNYLLTGATGMFGLEYTFWFPLQLSVDLRPTVGFLIGQGSSHGFYIDGISFGFIPTLSARYRF